MSYNYITDLNTNAVYKTTSPEGAKLIQRYMNQVGGAWSGWKRGDATPPHMFPRRRDAMLTKDAIQHKLDAPIYAAQALEAAARGLHFKDHQSTIQAAILEMHARTRKFPAATISFLADADLDIEVAVAKLEQVSSKDWKVLLRRGHTEKIRMSPHWALGVRGAEEGTRHAVDMRRGERAGSRPRPKKSEKVEKARQFWDDEFPRLTRLLAYKLWKKLPQEEKQSYEDAAKEVKAAHDEKKREEAVERDERERERERKKEVRRIHKSKQLASRTAQQAWESSDEAAKSASEVVAKVAGDAATAALDKEFGPNTTVYNAGGHDLTASRTLARLDSLIWAVRNSSLMAQRFSKLT